MKDRNFDVLVDAILQLHAQADGALDGCTEEEKSYFQGFHDAIAAVGTTAAAISMMYPDQPNHTSN